MFCHPVSPAAHTFFDKDMATVSEKLYKIATETNTRNKPKWSHKEM